ncbi:MAG: ATP phosphoribosyltransferase regulatory subunit [Syntrophomonadaceae bacterium]|nr:ATP phosphoribosyltransferase regulatory subunit [Syntrophomonadaceae bacterium]
MKTREIPPGFKDFLPGEVKLKRKVEEQAAALFASWGYQEVITPIVEYLDAIESAGTGADQQELFLFQNRDGRLLALRPDMTIPIARLASTKLREEPLPLRLFYQANVFRCNSPQRGKYNEFWQIGVEMVGASGERADAEVIALAVETMNLLGVTDFQLSLNHIGIFNGLLQESGLLRDEQEELKLLVIKKDLVTLEKELAGWALPGDIREAFLMLPVLHGGLEILERVPGISRVPGAVAGVHELQRLFHALQAFGVEDRVVIDLGVLRGLDYYTGVVFEGYSSNLGYPLLGGGRYDNVMERFGWPNPATGFAIGVERVLLAMQEPPALAEPKCIVAGRDLARVMEAAKRLRNEGWIVGLDVQGQTREELEMLCRQRNCRLVLVD